MEESGLSIPEVGRRLSVPPSSIGNWVKANGKLGDVGKKHRILSEEEVELARLKRELAEVKMERDIKRQRTLQRSRSEVRDDREITAPVSSAIS